jgi:hypothetical protein
MGRADSSVDEAPQVEPQGASVLTRSSSCRELNGSPIERRLIFPPPIGNPAEL